MALLQVQEVPPEGPLTLQAVYRRRDLHARFGGNRQAGIVPSVKERAVLLFHTKEQAQQFYGDGWDEDGLYWYSGEGVEGDMRWTTANVAIRDHAEAAADLLLFERAQRQDGLWRLQHRMRYVAHKYTKRSDKSGRIRKAIVFAMRPAR